MKIDEGKLLKELTFKAVRSSGSGGQHVNKVSSKIELSFNIKTSEVFSDDQKLQITSKLQNRLTNEGVLLMQCDESRSQHKNKDIIIKRFLSLIKESLVTRKKRKPTKIPRAVLKKRLKRKKRISEKKVSRRKPDID